jgi:phosphate-selective porin OprO/OprP
MLIVSRHKTSFALICLAVFLGLCRSNTVDAQQPDDPPTMETLNRRILELENVVRSLQTGRSGENAPATTLPPPDTEQAESGNEDGTGWADGAVKDSGAAKTKAASTRPPADAGWDKGFFLRSQDKKYSLRITGQLQSDYRGFLHDDDTTDIDTFLVRRARLGIEATVWEHYEFRLLPDFGQGVTRIQDAYMNVHYWDAFQVETGKFKQPFSYEQLIQDRYVPTLERSMIDQLVPARDVGVMVHGQKLFQDRLDYAVAVANGEINGDFDTEDRKDLAARVAIRPFNSDACWPALRGLQLGMSVTTGVEKEPMLPRILRTPATVPWFQFNAAVRADGLRNRWSPEIAYFCQGFGFAAQYFCQDQELRPAATGPASENRISVPFEGYYFLASCLLTGEERTSYSQQITPLRPFDPYCPCQLCGAWELVARLSRLRLGEVVFADGLNNLADPALFASGATELTLGFNWYLNPWVRVQLNWEHAWFDDPVRLGTGPDGLFEQMDTLLTRFQVIF